MDGRFLRLSVSSVGSEAMQRGTLGAGPGAVATFQYPRSDRRRCNLRGEVFGIDLNAPFSILGRIGGDATLRWERKWFWSCHLSVSSVGSEAMQPPPAHPLSTHIAIFQYPRSDRRRCNLGSARAADRMLDALSVSSVGSEAMQPPRRGRPPPRRRPFQYPRSDRRRCNVCGVSDVVDCCDAFSILGRIGGDATSGGGSSGTPYNLKLSVSSVGSEAMQPPNHLTENSNRYDFQYPRSDRRRCNPIKRACCPGMSSLSVSSVGSEAMQPRSPPSA